MCFACKTPICKNPLKNLLVQHLYLCYDTLDRSFVKIKNVEMEEKQCVF